MATNPDRCRLFRMRTAALQSIRVKNPCSENYDAMTSVHGGKFCGSCNHVVTDFTAMSDQEIILFLKSKDQKVCGRFQNDQLAPAKSRWSTALKVSVFAALSLWFAKTDLKAQKPQVASVPGAKTISDSVVVIVRGNISSDGKKVYRSRIEALDSAGNVIATAHSYDGKFELHVPVAYPKEAFRIVVSSKGYREEKIENYVSSAGNVLGIDMTRKLFGKPSRGYVTIGCPSF